MSKYTLIAGAKLTPMLGKLIKMGVAYHDALHEYAVSAIFHAATTGDIRPMQNFYDKALNDNGRTSFRLYLQRTFREHEDAKCLSIKENKFSMTEGGHKSKQAAVLADLAKGPMLNPDGKEFMRFFEREIIAETAQFIDDVKIASALKALLKKAEGKSDNVASHVSKALISKLSNVVDFATAAAEAAKNAPKQVAAAA